ncbi:MAG: hypothetical protein ACR2PG_19275 [Hyphomicrobiaceae bacterium]
MRRTNKIDQPIRLLVAALVILPAMQLAGCARYEDLGFYGFEDQQFGYYRARRDKITAGAGDAVAHNIAAQTIDPWPRHAANKRIDIDGERALIAIDRYKANKSIEPTGLETQSIWSTGNGK